MEKEKKPLNLLFIITDQQRKDHLSCYNSNIPLKTPNIDSIADGGMRFTNYYCATPICMPNRASFFTGAYPSVHGTRSNGINLDSEIPTISEVLRKQGYHTITVGKTHFNFYAPSNSPDVSSLEEIPLWLQGKIKSPFPTPYYGFDKVILTVGHGDIMVGHYLTWLEEKSPEQADLLRKRIPWIFKTYYDTVMPEELYPTTFITEKSVDFLERYSKGESGDKPFFLHVSYNDPHHPVCPPGKYKDMFDPKDIELPSNFNDGEKLFEHEVLGKYIKDSRFPHLLPVKVDEEATKIFTALTYGSIAMIDDGVGKILNTLKRLGLEENTMIIFTSDHGDLCGQHGLILKGPAHYRGIINIPLLVKAPEITKTSVSDSLINTIDLPRTILNLFGINEDKHPETFQGLDFTPILEDSSKRIRDRILIEHDEEISEDTIMRLRTLVTERHRLTIYDGHENVGDLFDLKNDSNEVNNLWHKDINLKNKLTEELLREIIRLRPRLPKRNAYN